MLPVKPRKMVVPTNLRGIILLSPLSSRKRRTLRANGLAKRLFLQAADKMREACEAGKVGS